MHALALESDKRNERFVNRDREAVTAAVRTSIRLIAATGGLAIIAAATTVLLVRRLLARLAQQRTELTRLSMDILQTQEATLRRVSHDLHDQIGQTLTALEANLGALDSSSSRDWTVRGRVEDCLGLVQDVMAQTRTMSQLLRPSVLDDFGLNAALEPLVQNFEQRTGIAVALTSTWAQRLPESAETNLYRVVQEALTNVARHSGATTVAVSLARDDEALALVIEDNGKGLPKAALSGSGVGLRSMRARAAQVGGTLTLENGRGGGLRVVFRIPLELAHADERQDAIAVG